MFEVAAIPEGRFSIVIPTLNEGDLLRMTVDSIRDSTRYPDWEILILDDGSTDGSTAAYRNGNGRIRVIDGGGNGGLSSDGPDVVGQRRADALVAALEPLIRTLQGNSTKHRHFQNARRRGWMDGFITFTTTTRGRAYPAVRPEGLTSEELRRSVFVSTKPLVASAAMTGALAGLRAWAGSADCVERVGAVLASLSTPALSVSR